MPGPLIPLVLLGLGAAGLGWAALATRPTAPSGGAVAKDLAKRVADEGPKGEWVFKPEIADSLVKSLSGQTYQYVDPNLDDTVTIAPDPSGRPVALSNTAMAWCRQQNDARSILAPLYMATATPQKRFLRAVKPGQEQNYTGPETGYAVLLYAGTISRGEAPPGHPSGGGTVKPIPDVTPPAVKPDLPILPPQPTPGGGGVPSTPSAPAIPGLSPTGFVPGVLDEGGGILRAQVKAQLDDLCANGKDPAAMEAVAAEAERFGFTAEAACLRARAAQLRAQQVPPPAPAPPPPPAPQPVGPFTPPPQPVPPPAPPPAVPPPSLQPQFAVVTTSDAPISGDLIVFASPSGSGPTRFDPIHKFQMAPNQIGGADKNGVVTLLGAPLTAEGRRWQQIQWNGSSRVSPPGWPAVTGFVHAEFLRPSASAPVAPAPPGGGLAVPSIPGGLLPGGLPGGLANVLDQVSPKARVTTNDQPPSGDLIIRATPSMSGPTRSFPQGQGAPNQIGGADKNGIVQLVGLPVSAEGTLWQQVTWPGSSRTSPLGWPAATGFVKAQFLSPVSPTTIAGTGGSSGLRKTRVAGVYEVENPLGRSYVEVGAVSPTEVDGEGRAATVVSSSGMRLRESPGPQGRTLSLIPAGTQVRLHKVAPGPKGDPRSPGPGGWALVSYEGRPGWVQAEWLHLG